MTFVMPAESGRRSRLELFLVVLVIAAGLAIRLVNLDSVPFWCDEAESSINALTILEHGYPSDSYLGLPIFENTLVQPWPENPEYEFKDISYSDKGMAVYHGWLPLYAFAGSFALHHIKPDESNPSLKIRYTGEEARRRTRAGRLPSVLFGLLFVLIAFAAGRAFYGRDAGWIALIAAAALPWQIQISQQARYYSATITLSTACCLLVWLMVTRRRWRDFVLGGLLFVLLFHTHLLSFFTAATVFALMTPIVLYRSPDSWKKIAAFGSIVAAGAIPWVLITDFYRHQSKIPRGWSLLSLPGDLVEFMPTRPVHLIIGLAFLIFIAWLFAAKPKLSERLKSPFVDSTAPGMFLLLWIATGYLSFLMLMPAASFAQTRLNLSYWGPEVILGSMIAAAAVRVFMPKFSAWNVAAGLILVTLTQLQPSLFEAQYAAMTWTDLDQVAGQLTAMKLMQGSRLYASPNDQLTLTFYTGLPVQSIVPIRKSFLNSYPGDVVIVESVQAGRFESLRPEELQKGAKKAGTILSRDDAERLSAELLTLDYQQAVARNMGVEPPSGPEGLPGFAKTAWQLHEKTASEPVARNDLMTRGFRAANWLDWLDVFFYRFVDPESRRHSNLNYIERLHGARSFALIPAGLVILHSPAVSTADGSAGLDFEVIRASRAAELRSARSSVSRHLEARQETESGYLPVNSPLN